MPPTPEPSPAAPVVDPRALAELAAVDDGGTPNLLERLCHVFLEEEGPRCLRELRRALTAGDGPAFAAQAHRLAGSGLVFGAARLVQACRAGEAADGAAVGSLAAIDAAFAEVAAELRRRVLEQVPTPS